MTIVTAGINLAKNVFAVYGVDETGKPALVRPSVVRGKPLEMIAKLPPCLLSWKPAQAHTIGHANLRSSATSLV